MTVIPLNSHFHGAHFIRVYEERREAEGLQEPAAEKAAVRERGHRRDDSPDEWNIHSAAPAPERRCVGRRNIALI